MAAEINYQDIRVCTEDPMIQEVFSCSDPSCPELDLIPGIQHDGDAYSYMRKDRDRFEGNIFVKPGRGVCARKSHNMKKTRVELFDIESAAQVDCRALRHNNAAARSAHNAVLDPVEEAVRDARMDLDDGLVHRLYNPYGYGAPGLDDFVCFHINALDGEWNGEADFITDILGSGADPDNLTPAQIAALEAATGGFLDAYVLYLSPGGFHLDWGLGEMIEESEWETFRVKDPVTGCYRWVKEKRFMGTTTFSNRCPYDVVKICNIPCKRMFDKFFFDNILDAIPALYDGARVTPNAVLFSHIVKTNWWGARKKQGIEAGGCNPCGELEATPLRDMMEYNGMALITSQCIGRGEFSSANADRKRNLKSNAKPVFIPSAPVKGKEAARAAENGDPESPPAGSVDEPAGTEGDDEKTPVSDLTVPQLQELAEENKIEFKKSWDKKKLLAAIEEAGAIA